MNNLIGMHKVGIELILLKYYWIHYDMIVPTGISLVDLLIRLSMQVIFYRLDELLRN